MNITLYRNPFRTLTALAPLYRPLSIMDEIDEIAREFSRRIGLDGNTLIPHTDMYEEKGELVAAERRRHPGIPRLRSETRAQRLVVGVGCQTQIWAETTRHAAPPMGVWHRHSLVFAHFQAEKQTVKGPNLLEKGQISWLNARTRCPLH